MVGCLIEYNLQNKNGDPTYTVELYVSMGYHN